MPMIDPPLRDSLSLPAENDSRWQEVFQLVVRAEEKPAAERRDFILAAQADPFVIRHALAILDGSVSMAGSASVGCRMPLPDDEPFVGWSGMKIGKYRVGALLGSGSGGSVYTGFDEELNRAVAIKFYARRRQSSGVSGLPVREARAASALNHPNIIMIHEVIETGDAAAIVMELVSGETLRALAGKRPNMEDILHWSSQLAGALAVAHASNLIHGDIKPENIMVRADGYVKLLDFGLSLAAQPDQQAAATLTGTPRYLSPEQCLGKAPTQASDVFAFGVVLYELTAGCHPFQAQGMLGLLQSITSVDPARPASLNPKLPRSLDRLIMEMLDKRPQARPTAQQAVERLATIARLPPAELSLFGVRARWWAVAALAAAAAALSFVWIQPRGSLDLARMNVHPLAAQNGLETAPSISPDGLWVACLHRAKARDRAQFQVHAAQGGPPVVIDTDDLVLEDPAAWSPDSRELVFVGARAGKRSIYRTSRTGGPRILISECVRGCEIDWSPDGRSLAVSDFPPGQTATGISLLDLASGQRRVVVPPGNRPVSTPRFSPDGKWIAFSRQAAFSNRELWVTPTAGGAARSIVSGAWWIAGFGWSTDGQSLLAIAARKAGKIEMWQFPFQRTAEPRRVTSFDVGQAQHISIARRSASLVWARDLSSSSLWRMPVDQPNRPAELVVNSSGSETDGESSRDGRIVSRSDRSGWSEIWITRADGSEPRQATRFQGPFVGDPHWSPDGRHVAFNAHSNGNADIFTMDCTVEGPQPCGNPKQLTQTPSTDANPTWSADGQSIYFSSNRSGGRFEVWRIPATGGEAVRVTWNRGYFARESADGKWLYYSKFEQPGGFWRIPLPATGPDQQEKAVVPQSPFWAGATWALGPRELYYYPPVEEGSLIPFPPVRAVDLATGRRRDLPTGKKILGRGLSLSADGKWLLRTQIDRVQSLIMIAE